MICIWRIHDLMVDLCPGEVHIRVGLHRADIYLCMGPASRRGKYGDANLKGEFSQRDQNTLRFWFPMYVCYITKNDYFS